MAKLDADVRSLIHNLYTAGSDTWNRIKQKNSVEVPFDVRRYKYFEYDLNRLDELEKWLDSAFRSAPQRYEFDRKPE